MKRILTAMLAIGLLCACAGFSAPANTKSETAKQSLADTGTAMAKLRSVRFDATAMVTLTLPQALVDQLQAKTGSQAEFITSNTTVHLSLAGAAAKPDELEATIKATLGGVTINSEVIAKNGTVYVKDPMTGKWQVLPRHDGATPDQSKSGVSMAAMSYQAVLDTARSLTEINDQPQPIGGVGVDHYRVVPDVLKLFAQAIARHPAKSPQAVTAIQNLLQNVNLTADLWTGNRDHLIRRLSYDVDVTADLSALAAALVSRESSNGQGLTIPAGSVAHVSAHAVVNLHDFNASVTIKVPTGTP